MEGSGIKQQHHHSHQQHQQQQNNNSNKYISGFTGPISTNNDNNNNRNYNNNYNKQGIAETAKTNGPTCDNMCIQKI